MKRTILTPERKAVREAQKSKWLAGYAGAATSWPYRVKRYLSKELSDKIRSEVQAKCDEWSAKLDSIKPSKRFETHSNWCKELHPQCCCVDSYEENAIPTKVLGHKIYVKILDSYCKRNGQLGIWILEKPILEISRYFNSPKDDSDWHHIGEQLNFEICWSEEKQLYFVAEYHRAQTGKVDTSRRNWGRTRAKKSFMNEVAQLEDRLTNDGVQIGEMKETNLTLGWKNGLERNFIDCIGPEVMA